MGITITNSGQGSVVRFRNLGRGGLMTSTVVPPLLNQYSGALTAISLRKLNINYTGPAVRVRRSSDNAETDIGFVANALDTTSLLNFVNAENYLVYSQDYTQTSWVKTAVTVTANAGIAPDGTNTAQKCVPSATVTTKAIYQVLPSASTRDYVFSIYAKAAEYNYMQLLAIRDSTNRYSIIVDLTTGAITQTNTAGTPNFINSSVTSVGNGWYRIVITLNINLGTNYFVFCPSPVSNPTLNASLDLQSAGNGTSGVLFWGAQLNYFSLKSYTVTTTAAIIPTTTNGFVTTWYDQSGNARNFVQTTTASQPRIVNSGVTELVNSKPAVYFDGVDDSILSTFSSANSVTTIFDVFKINEPAAWVTHTLSGNYILAGNTINPAAADSIGYSARYKNSALTLTTTQTEVRAAYNTNTQILFTEIVASSTISSFGISTFGGEWHMLGHFQECILYGSDQSTNRTAIESNINSNYRIY